MAKISILQGATSVTVNIWIADSSSATGAGLTGLVFNTAGLTCYYMRPKIAATAVTLATLAAVTSAYSSGGFKEIDSANAPGWYRFDIPDAAIANAERFCSFHFKGAANMAPLPLEVELTGWNNQSTTDGGLSKLTSLTFTVASQIDANVIDWKSATAPAMTGDAFARLGAPAGASTAVDIAAVKTDTAAVKVQTDKLAFTVPNQVDSNVIDWKGATAPAMTGDAFARIGVAGVGLTNLGDTRIANLDAAVSSRGTSVYAGGAVASVTAGVTLAAGAIDAASLATAGKQAIADSLLDRDMSVGTDSGTETFRTPRQALRVLRNKVDIPGGKVKKEDDATDSFTFATTTAAGNPVTVVDPTGP